VVATGTRSLLRLGEKKNLTAGTLVLLSVKQL